MEYLAGGSVLDAMQASYVVSLDGYNGFLMLIWAL